MEHFIFLFVCSFPSDLVFCFTPQSVSQSLLCPMYVTPIRGYLLLLNTWMFTLNMLWFMHKSLNSLSVCLSFSGIFCLYITQTFLYRSLHPIWISLRIRWDSNPGVRRVPQTALNLSDTLMPVGFKCPWMILNVRVLVCSITSISDYRWDLILCALNFSPGFWWPQWNKVVLFFHHKYIHLIYLMTGIQ